MCPNWKEHGCPKAQIMNLALSEKSLPVCSLAIFQDFFLKVTHMCTENVFSDVLNQLEREAVLFNIFS